VLELVSRKLRQHTFATIHQEDVMNARFRLATGTVLFLYFGGAFLGANLVALAGALSAGGRVIGPSLGVLLALMLPVLPLAHARRAAEQPFVPES
jgi:hypothetical protein